MNAAGCRVLRAYVRACWSRLDADDRREVFAEFLRADVRATWARLDADARRDVLARLRLDDWQSGQTQEHGEAGRFVGPEGGAAGTAAAAAAGTPVEQAERALKAEAKTAARYASPEAQKHLTAFRVTPKDIDNAKATFDATREEMKVAHEAATLGSRESLAAVRLEIEQVNDARAVLAGKAGAAGTIPGDVADVITDTGGLHDGLETLAPEAFKEERRLQAIAMDAIGTLNKVEAERKEVARALSPSSHLDAASRWLDRVKLEDLPGSTVTTQEAKATIEKLFAFSDQELLDKNQIMNRPPSDERLLAIASAMRASTDLAYGSTELAGVKHAETLERLVMHRDEWSAKMAEAEKGVGLARDARKNCDYQRLRDAALEIRHVAKSGSATSDEYLEKKLAAQAASPGWGDLGSRQPLNAVVVSPEVRDAFARTWERAKLENQIVGLRDKERGLLKSTHPDVQSSTVTAHYFAKKDMGEIHERISTAWVSSVSVEPDSIALHTMLASEFGVPYEGVARDAPMLAPNDRAFPASTITAALHAGRVTSEVADRAADIAGLKPAALKAYVREMYTLSQATLPAVDADGNYTLYRGITGQQPTDPKMLPARTASWQVENARGEVRLFPATTAGIEGEAAVRAAFAAAHPGETAAVVRPWNDARREGPAPVMVGDKHHFATRPASSWSDLKAKADDFARLHKGGTIVSEKVHSSRIYANYNLFKNTYDENEFVVLNTADTTQEIIARYDAALIQAAAAASIQLTDDDENWMNKLREIYAEREAKKTKKPEKPAPKDEPRTDDAESGATQGHEEDGTFASEGGGESGGTVGSGESSDEDEEANDVYEDESGDGPDLGPAEHWDVKKDGPLYHVTYLQHLESIGENGLDASGGVGIGENSNNAEHSQKGIFLSDKEGASFWRGRFEDHANDRSDDPRGDNLTPVTLRINQSMDVHPDERGSDDSAARAVIATESIAPKHIEFYYEGKWHPLSDAPKIDLAKVYSTETDPDDGSETHYLKDDHENPLVDRTDDAESGATQGHEENGQFSKGEGGGGGGGGTIADRSSGLQMPGASVRREETPDHVASRLAYFHQRQKLAGKTGPPPTPSEHGALCDKLAGITDGASDAAIEPNDPHAFSTLDRRAVLGNIRGVVERATGIPQKWKVTELRIASLSGANGILTSEHQSGDPALPPTDVPGRITIDTAVHFGAQSALADLSLGQRPSDRAIGNLKTYIHETCHTTSPMTLRENGYEGYGAVIEEVTTEVMARDVMAKILPDNIVSPHSQILEPRAGGSRSSYQPAIDWTLTAIRDSVGSATGVKGFKATAAEARANPQAAERRAEFLATRILNDATLSYRALAPAAPFTREKAAQHFADAIGAAAVKHHPERELHAGEVSERVRLQFRQLDSGEDNDLLRRFDAASSIWQVPRSDVPAAMAFVMARHPSPDEMRILLMLQDDPTELLAALEALRALDPTRFDDWESGQTQGHGEAGRFVGEGGGSSGGATKAGGDKGEAKPKAAPKGLPDHLTKLEGFPKERLFASNEPPPDPVRASDRAALSRVLSLPEASGDDTANAFDDGAEPVRAHATEAYEVYAKLTDPHREGIDRFTKGYDTAIRKLESGASPEEVTKATAAHLDSRMKETGYVLQADGDYRNAWGDVRSYRELSNKFLHGAVSPEKHTERAQASIAHLNDMFKTAPQSAGVAYRGFKQIPTAIVEKMLSSKSLTLDSMSSFSRDRTIADRFATLDDEKDEMDKFGEQAVLPNGVDAILRVKQATGVNVSNASNYSDEREILIPKGTRFKITKITRERFRPTDCGIGIPPRLIIDAEEI